MNNISSGPHIYDDYKYADFFINKETEYYYFGSSLEFTLSHALFSSYEVDSGTRLLLKTLAPFLKKRRPGSILDAGCGTGVLGTALKKAAPEAELYLYDRDALAVYFTELNLHKNRIDKFQTAASLLMFPFENRKFDLIVSNLPAKAGHEVLSDFIQQAPFHLTEKGIAAVVIVKPLSDFASETLEDNCLEILETVKTANYSVFIFKYPEEIYSRITSQTATLQQAASEGNNTDNQLHIKSDKELFKSYIRKEKQPFEIKGNNLFIDTATGLPDFDRLSFNTKFAAELVLSVRDSVKADCRQLVINPGQGLIPVLLKTLSISDDNSETELLISSNDLLQLKITEKNLKNISASGSITFLTSPTVFNTADSIDTGTLDTIIFFYSSVPGFKKHDLIMRRLNMLLKHGGKLILASTSSEVSRFLNSSRGFVNVRGKKNKGIRAVYLKKSADAV